MDVSVYSLIAVSRGAAPLMTDGGSIMTMSYYAAEKGSPTTTSWPSPSPASSAPSAISLEPGPKTFASTPSLPALSKPAARGVGDLTEMMRAHAERAPLHRNVDQLEVGGAALFLASDLASAITGECSTSTRATTSWVSNAPGVAAASTLHSA